MIPERDSFLTGNTAILSCSAHLRTRIVAIQTRDNVVDRTVGLVTITILDN